MSNPTDPPGEPRPALASPILGAIALVLGFVFVQVLAGSVLYGLDIELDLDGTPSDATILGLLAVQVAGVVAGVGVAAARHAGPLAPALARIGLAGTPAGSLGTGFRQLLPVGMLVVLPVLGYALARGDGVVSDDLTASSALLLVALACAIALNEELWFRGLVIDQLRQCGRPWLVVVLASLLFGLPHVTNDPATWLNAAAVTLAVAVPFTVVRMACASLWPLVAWHAIIDIWAFLHTGSVVAEGSPSLTDALITLVLPAIVAIAYALWWRGTGRRGFTP